MRKKFDLEYYLEHPDTKVVTRNGNSARILCTDLKDDDGFCVAAAVTYEDGQEWVDRFHPNGNLYHNCESDHDLFFDLPDPEKKRVPLTDEDLLERVKAGKTMWFVNDGDIAFNIVDFDLDSVYIINGGTEEIVPYSYEELRIGMTFVDGEPCWKEVEE